MKSKNPFHIRYLPTWFGLGLIRLLCFLPYSIAIYVGVAVGFLVNHLLPSRKRIAKINIDLCFPAKSKEEKQQLLKATMTANGIGAVESLYSLWAKTAHLTSRSQVNGIELIEKAQAEGRGVILLGAHFTTLDFCGVVLGNTVTIDTMYKTQSNAAVDYCLKNSRLRNCESVLEKNELRQFIKNLRQKHVIWYACDQDFGRQNSVFAPFFGIEAATLATLGRLIKMTNAKPLMAKHVRDSSNGLSRSKYIIDIYDPFEDEPLTENDQRNAELINQALEEAIKEQPDQYFWVHRRFKRRPDNQKNPYRK